MLVNRYGLPLLHQGFLDHDAKCVIFPMNTIAVQHEWNGSQWRDRV